NQDFVASYIQEKLPSVKYRKAQGTYLAWLDMSEIFEAVDAERLAREASESTGRNVSPEDIVQTWLAENASVFLSPGDVYGAGGSGFMRMNLGTQRGRIQLAVDNIAAAVATL
ncbi:MAG: hypothetical protein P8L45_07835, partial [Longimicrobiales bacterium]|nr:hypothetical protein [Longimicrobiales bacterium]